MSVTYFRPRDRFDFSKDTLDIGNPVQWDRSQFLKHFFKRVFAIPGDRIEVFYQRHLAYYLANHADGSEEIFFKYFWSLIERQLNVLLNKDIYDKNHLRNEREMARLQKFTELLISFDRWNFHKSNDAVIAQQDSEIYVLKQEIIQLKADLKKATALETEGYINIADGYRNTVLHLYLQMQEIKTPEGKELMFSQTQSVWTKMICKYFREGDREINHETIRRYFPSDKRERGDKHADIPAKSKLFTINPAKRRS
ncbi:hypothetical protein [Mucilaginibacter sp.]|uniref:hypothetical protein n=1 Tax=Mucilaginibacter sp. TaxID=1882438 RepID=UPI0026198457|nr:hypothetical protein [Mucilaginibacter sp.]MDB4925943.1 hypothetical protein [Mucilaginibacter sp.]